MKLVIAGATGLVGGKLIERALADSRVETITVVGRKRLAMIHPKLRQVVIGNFSELAGVPKESGPYHALCALGTTIKAAGSESAFREVDYNAILQFATWTKEAESFSVISAVGANSNSRFFYNQVKGDTEQALEKMGFKSLLIYRPGLLVGQRQEYRMAESLILRIYPIVAALLPHRVISRWATDVESLADVMLKNLGLESQGLRVFDASEL